MPTIYGLETVLGAIWGEKNKDEASMIKLEPFSKGQEVLVVHVIVVALGTESNILISVDISIIETAEKGTVKISQGFRFPDLLE